MTIIIFIVFIRYAECRDDGMKRLKGQCDLGHHLLVPDSEKRLKVRCTSYIKIDIDRVMVLWFFLTSYWIHTLKNFSVFFLTSYWIHTLKKFSVFL
jgi:hypothetical protein